MQKQRRHRIRVEGCARESHEPEAPAQEQARRPRHSHSAKRKAQAAAARSHPLAQHPPSRHLCRPTSALQLAAEPVSSKTWSASALPEVHLQPHPQPWTRPEQPTPPSLHVRAPQLSARGEQPQGAGHKPATKPLSGKRGQQRGRPRGKPCRFYPSPPASAKQTGTQSRHTTA